MKKLFVILLGVFALGAATPAQAQVKFGVKGGLNVTYRKISSQHAAGELLCCK